MNLRLALIVFTFSFVVVIYVGLIRKGQEDLDSKTMLPFQIKPLTMDRFRGNKPEVKKEKKLEVSPVKEAPQAMTLEGFRKENPGYKIEQTSDGRVISLVAMGEATFRSHQAIGAFHPKNQEQVLARAEVILQELSGILKVSSQMPLALPQISSTDFSAQITYQQTLENIPVMPAGTVSVVLSSSGGVKRLHSSYLPTVTIMNHRKIQGEGKAVLWIQSYEPVAQARHAFETRDHGMQKIVDAEDRSIILSRDKKIK